MAGSSPCRLAFNRTPSVPVRFKPRRLACHLARRSSMMTRSALSLMSGVALMITGRAGSGLRHILGQFVWLWADEMRPPDGQFCAHRRCHFCSSRFVQKGGSPNLTTRIMGFSTLFWHSSTASAKPTDRTKTDTIGRWHLTLDSSDQVQPPMLDVAIGAMLYGQSSHWRKTRGWASVEPKHAQ